MGSLGQAGVASISAGRSPIADSKRGLRFWQGQSRFAGRHREDNNVGYEEKHFRGRR